MSLIIKDLLKINLMYIKKEKNRKINTFPTYFKTFNIPFLLACL